MLIFLGNMENVDTDSCWTYDDDKKWPKKNQTFSLNTVIIFYEIHVKTYLRKRFSIRLCTFCMCLGHGGFV